MKNRNLWLIAVILCLVSVSVYLPALHNDFVNWDDDDYVYNNPKINDPLSDFMMWSFSTSRTGYWHPLTWLSLRVDYAFWKLNPMGYHLTSVLFHGLNTLLVVLLAGSLFMKGLHSKMGQVLFGTSVVGVLFALHPFHVESVVWISERKNVLYAFFWLLSLLAYTEYASSARGRRKALLFLLCFMTFALSIASKPMAVTLPFVLLILDFYPLKRLDLKSRFIKVAILEKLPFFLLSGAVTFVTIIMQKKEGAMATIEHLSLWKRFVGAIKGLGFYLSKTLWPDNLLPFYPIDPEASLLTLESMLSLIFVLSVTAVSVALWKRRPLLISAWSYYLITLLPVLGIIQVGAQSAADRYMYLPIVGPFMIIGALGAIAWEKGRYVRYLSVAFIFFFSAAITVVTVNQIPVWKDSLSLWSYVTGKKPDVALAHNNIGQTYATQGLTDDAIKEFLRAIQIDPGYFHAHNNLGIAYTKQGRTEEAIKEFLTVVQLKPDHFRAHNNLGIAYAKQGRTEEAIKEFLTAVQIHPAHSNAHNNLGVLFIQAGRLQDAVREFQIASDLDPDNTELKQNLEMLKGMVK